MKVNSKEISLSDRSKTIQPMNKTKFKLDLSNINDLNVNNLNRNNNLDSNTNLSTYNNKTNNTINKLSKYNPTPGSSNLNTPR